MPEMAPAPTPTPLTQAPSNIGPVAQPQANKGNMAAAVSDIKNAVQLLQKALPLIPMGSPLHADILEVTKKISKHLSQTEGTEGPQLQSLLQMARGAAQSAPQQALMRMFPAQGANSPPAMPQPQAGA